VKASVANRSSAIGHRRSELGFSLLEVLIALLILAMSLTILLSSQSSSMAAASRSRDITIATLLARSKMVDIERKISQKNVERNQIQQDEQNIRSNISVLPAGSKSRDDFIADLTARDNDLKKVTQELKDLQVSLDKARADLEAYLSDMNVES